MFSREWAVALPNPNIMVQRLIHEKVLVGSCMHVCTEMKLAGLFQKKQQSAQNRLDNCSTGLMKWLFYQRRSSALPTTVTKTPRKEKHTIVFCAATLIDISRSSGYHSSATGIPAAATASWSI
jgi:hypothetical protein